MREKGPFRPDPLDHLQRLLHAEMRGMGLEAESPDNQHIQPLQQLETRIRDAAHIREVGRGAEAPAVDRQLPVQKRNRHHLHRPRPNRLPRPGRPKIDFRLSPAFLGFHP